MDFVLDLEGKIRNTKLPKTKALLPLFEAVINSIHAIEDSGKNDGKILIKIIRRDQELSFTGEHGVAPITGFEIHDNGVGFNEDNFKSFLTSDSTYKKKKGSKGIGRFTWLKAFSSVIIKSTYLEKGEKHSKHFYFRKDGIEEISQDSSQEDKDKIQKLDTGTRVSLLDIVSPYSKNIPQDDEVIGRSILEHCLSYFLLNSIPTIEIWRDPEKFNYNFSLNQLYQTSTKNLKTDYVCKIKNKDFNIKTLKFYRGQNNKNHTISYCANNREVLSETINKKYLIDFGKGTKRLSDSDGHSFVYFVCISSSYLDENVDSSRISFDIEDKITEASSTDEISMTDIREDISNIINKDLSSILNKIRDKKEQQVKKYIQNEGPMYRSMIKYHPEIIEKISPNINNQNLELELHKLFVNYESELKQEGQKIANNLFESDLNYSDALAQYEQFTLEYNDLGASKLVNYVIHRKIILSLLERTLQRKDNDKYSLEKEVHALIYPMNKDSDNVNYINQNLWIIDERLSYHYFLASDKKFKNMAVDNISIKSENRPDLVIFNNPTAFVEDENPPYTSIVIIEFKRPMRKNYSDDENPVSQCYNYIREIRSGEFIDKDGVLVSLPENVPFYVYIICDLTKNIKNIAEDSTFSLTPDRQGYFGFNKHFNAYIEIISFPKLLSDAKKRNRVLFNQLSI